MSLLNTYSEQKDTVRTGNDLFGNLVSLERFETRGDFLKYFSQKTGYPIPRVAYKLTKTTDLPTLFYIKSVCDQAVLEGKKENYRHAFNSCLFVPSLNVLGD